jgi:hypothetical protein
LHSLRAATHEPAVIGNDELDRLCGECRQVGIITQDLGLLRLYRDLKKGAKSALTVLVLANPEPGKSYSLEQFRLPPLRERVGDVPILADMFLDESPVR